MTAISGLWALKGTQSAIISWNRDAGIGGELVGCYCWNRGTTATSARADALALGRPRPIATATICRHTSSRLVAPRPQSCRRHAQLRSAGIDAHPSTPCALAREPSGLRALVVLLRAQERHGRAARAVHTLAVAHMPGRGLCARRGRCRAAVQHQYPDAQRDLGLCAVQTEPASAAHHSAPPEPHCRICCSERTARASRLTPRAARLAQHAAGLTLAVLPASPAAKQNVHARRLAGDRGQPGRQAFVGQGYRRRGRLYLDPSRQEP